MSGQIWLLVPQNDLKQLKSTLELHGLFDKASKIQMAPAEYTAIPSTSLRDTSIDLTKPPMYKISSTLRVKSDDQEGGLIDDLRNILHTSDLGDDCLSGISINVSNMKEMQDVRRSPKDMQEDFTLIRDPVRRALKVWSNDLSKSLLDHNISMNEVCSSPPSYCVYGSMLLLSSNPFKASHWQNLSVSLSNTYLNQLWNLMAHETNTTHVAVNAPIPMNTTPTSSTNILRSPTALTPLYGDFGPPAPIPSPTLTDFTAAFWVTTKQNGIYQTWAPLHTMFSRGNIKEKARLLKLPSVLSCSENDEKWTAIDLYCGIGYFSFSYAQAGASVVLGWEINGWSVEGMKRGTEANKWRSVVLREDGGISRVETALKEGDKRPLLVTFHESNAFATVRVGELRARIPPIRHVNLGLLPSSAASCETAVNALDAELGGWLHVHENIAIRKPEYDDRLHQILNEIKSFVRKTPQPLREIRLEHVEHVKTYAPGVMHCVLDISIDDGAEQGQNVQKHQQSKNS